MDAAPATPLIHPDRQLRVVVADERPLVRCGWQVVLADLPEAALVGAAATGPEAVRLFAEQHAHVLVIDLELPGLGGAEAIRRVTTTDPSAAVLVLGGQDDDESIIAALDAGARGCVHKDAGASELVVALRTVAAGHVILGLGLSSRVLGRLTGSVPPIPGPKYPELTAREREILSRLATGMSDSRIARELFVEAKTVRNHIGNILPKLRASNRVEAVLMARAAGLGCDATTR